MNIIRKNKISEGFTLIEILIATAIFAMIMVITAATFSWAVAYNGKLREMRATSRSGMLIAEDISSETRLANGSIANSRYGPNWYKNYTGSDIRSGEIVLLNCSDLILINCVLHPPLDSDNLSDSMKDPVTILNDPGVNAVLIFNRAQKRISFYLSLKDSGPPYKTGATSADDLYNFSVYKRVAGFTDWPADYDPPNTVEWTEPDKLNTDDVSVEIDFGGFGPVSMHRDQQPYLEFMLTAKTLDYEIFQPNARDNFEIKTLVETREYNKP